MNLKSAMKATSSLSAVGILFTSSWAYADKLRILSCGGAYQKGQSVGFFEPFSKTTYITIKEGTCGVTFDK